MECLDQLITGLQAEIKGIPYTREDGRASKMLNVTAGIPGTNEPAELYMAGITVMANAASTLVLLVRYTYRHPQRFWLT